MGTYLNPGSAAFKEALNSEIFVDKTGMIQYLNRIICTKQKYVSVSRPRRFGKTMAADMLSAYYGRRAESRQLFEQCKISKIETGNDDLKWDEYLGKFNVIRLVMTDFFNRERSVNEAIKKVENRILDELSEEYPDTKYDETDFYYSIDRFYEKSKTQFIIIIDEWDAIFREYKEDKDGQKKYLDFIRAWMKDKSYIALAYMTGILPIKKYGKHSALNMFDEYSMTQPMQLAEYAGFTAEEVKELCRQLKLNYAGLQSWYDGYRLSNRVSAELLSEDAVIDKKIYRDYEVYSPYSVVKAARSKQLENYWNQTETYEALMTYIDWNFDGLKEEVAILMEGGRVKVDITGYQNDMTTFNTRYDILTMLIHLGYLGYDSTAKEIFIPNKEVLDVFRTSTKGREWAVIFKHHSCEIEKV